MDSFKQMHLQQALTSLGNVAALNRIVKNVGYVNKHIQSFEEKFKQYNPRKTRNPRYGLSITSLYGDFSNDIDLDSLIEYNRENGTKFKEKDFRKWTPFYKNCKVLQKIMEPFHKYMGRSHVLRLDYGGFFPPHRDSFTLTPGSFRLFISLCENIEKYCFLFDDKKIFFNAGRLYFINTQLNHSLISFRDNNYFIVFNIDLCEGAVQAVFDNLLVR